MTLKQTPLYKTYINTPCKTAPFAGWEMPIQFSGLINEHESVRKEVGLFDISHMGVFLIKGKNIKDLLQGLVPTDLHKIGPGEACYTVLLNENGGIIDDLIIYDQGHDAKNIESVLLVINAACIEEDIEWIKQHVDQLDLSINDFKKDGVLLAIQGPNSLKVLEQYFNKSLVNIPRFGHQTIFPKNNESSESIFIGRTGYTGEDGFELLLNEKDGVKLWTKLIDAGITPCGLGARDTLRLEAGMHLYGNEMNANTTPFEAGLGWLVNLEMPAKFIGREALEKQAQEGIQKKLVGLEINGRAIARKGYKLFKNEKFIGEVTSGTWSPSLKKAIAMGYVENEFAQMGTEVMVEIRGKFHAAKIVKRTFFIKEK
ncbi:glycine cleavage system aminomethyltransferase GcvT [Prochlorococcus sp. MIT 1223]|uniref:glycine cleavage system aminomethyltransferase GcvT n=1 Tax=Prochlorococcus sp. MIT 1223 TaxID=3096217 RepID=UPI002A75768A|nr:glycine cleavage system aminomethyltransferase GcvT [Prochlorococcus sp. MIT 1223]